MNTIKLEAIDLNLLVALDAILEEESLKRAATRLGITPSAVSHKLRSLREVIGDEILVGHGPRQVLTARARELRAPLRAALDALHRTIQAVKPFDPATSTRVFRVATGEAGELTVLLEAQRLLREEAPGVRVEFVRVDASSASRLEAGELDFVVGGPGPQSPGFMQKLVTRDPLAAVVRANHPRMGRAPTVDDYLALGHIVVPRADAVEHMLEAKGIARREAIRLDSVVVAAHLAAETDYVFTTALAFGSAMARRVRNLAVYPLAWAPDVPIYLWWHARSSGDAGAEWARAFAVRVTSVAGSATGHTTSPPPG